MSSVRTPVSPHDWVSDVLARDDSLVEVFIRHAPHFEKLRNRTMRRVMARLVTVEQAARTANIPADRLVRDLNAALGLDGGSSPAARAEASASAALATGDRHPESARVVELDVRDDLRSGREPFSRVMSAVSALRGDEVLHLRAIFEPVPLFTVLGKRGLVHESVAHAADDWSVWFWRPAASVAETISAAATVASGEPPFAGDRGEDGNIIYLDVRGSIPPEPMMRTLAALESLEAGQTLVQINSRVPQFLLPMLAERGFAWEIDASQPDRVLVRISRGGS